SAPASGRSMVRGHLAGTKASAFDVRAPDSQNEGDSRSRTRYSQGASNKNLLRRRDWSTGARLRSSHTSQRYHLSRQELSGTARARCSEPRSRRNAANTEPIDFRPTYGNNSKASASHSFLDALVDRSNAVCFDGH